MKVYVANFGEGNMHWPVCLANNVLTMYASHKGVEFWRSGDHEGWCSWAMANLRGRNGNSVIKPVASRWFNLITLFHETSDDLWLHRQGDELFWTTSRAGEITVEDIGDPFKEGRSHFLFRRPADAWLAADRHGRKLQWRALHRKAHDFLATEATFQELSNDRHYRDYAVALVNGDPLDDWHSSPGWVVKIGKHGPVTNYSTLEKTLFVAVHMIQRTVFAADGRIVEVAKKEKDLTVSFDAMREVLRGKYKDQEGLCALTGLKMLLVDESGPDDYRLSVDRIDSAGHYSPDNVQLVCRFANFWKSASADKRFRELIDVVRKGSYEA